MTEEEKLIKRDLQIAQWVGEDGGMVVDGKFSLETACRKMRRLLKREVGETESEDFKIDNIGIGYFMLPTPEDIEENGNDSEWYISIKDKSPYKVWVYWG